MSDALYAASRVATSGLNAQSARLLILSENLANASSTGVKPGSDAYRRKLIAFNDVVDQVSGEHRVEVAKIQQDKAPFILKFEPGHPAADARGYVKYPNVNPIIEMADIREANRNYEANLQVIKQSRELITQTINLLK